MLSSDKSGLVVTMLVLVLASCGFQLRGEQPMGLKSIYLSTAMPSQVAIQIRHSLAAGPTKLTPTAGEAEAQLRILTETREKLIQSITGAGRVFDFLLTLRVSYTLTDLKEEPLIPPAVVEVRRVITYSETAPLAKEAEEALLFKDMQADAAAQILRRIAVVKHASPP
jgi:LPS-assembly lipoprotein